MTIFLRSQLWLQNDGLNGFFRFVMISTLLREPILHKTADRRFQNGHRVNKMAPRCFLGWIPCCTGTKMATLWRIFTGRWVSSPLECIEGVSMCFNGLFIFALWCFCSTVISLGWINVIMQGTMVALDLPHQIHGDLLSNLLHMFHWFKAAYSSWVLLRQSKWQWEPASLNQCNLQKSWLTQIIIDSVGLLTTLSNRVLATGVKCYKAVQGFTVLKCYFHTCWLIRPSLWKWH